MEQLKNIIEQAWLDRSLIEKPETKEVEAPKAERSNK